MFKLTRRHQQVLDLIAQGLTNEEIAQTLSIRFGTASQYSRNVCLRLGARNRAHAVAIAHRHGLLTSQRPYDDAIAALKQAIAAEARVGGTIGRQRADVCARAMRALVSLTDAETFAAVA